MTSTIVLLSGGLDSSLLLVALAQSRPGVSLDGRENLSAAFVFYGQPNAALEGAAAKRLAKELSVPFTDFATADAFPRPHNLATSTTPQGSVVQARNVLLLSIALAHAPPEGKIKLAIGATRDDAEAFPDCRPRFLKRFEEMATEALDRDVFVEAPWLDCTKGYLLRQARNHPTAIAAARSSISCYRGTRCGVCSACRSRSEAFRFAEIEDQ